MAPYSYASDVRMLLYINGHLTGICDKFRYQNIEMYLWYPLIAIQWNRCDQHSRQTFNYLLKGTRLNSGM